MLAERRVDGKRKVVETKASSRMTELLRGVLLIGV
jgi:hypothetical protein